MKNVAEGAATQAPGAASKRTGKKKSVAESPKYPAWICSDCGDRYGRRPVGCATWHEGVCGVCGEEAPVTEPRDFGHLKDEWLDAVRRDQP